MNTNCTTTSCQPAITIACIISCALCTIIMIWGVFAMRQDISQMATGHTSMNMSDPMSMSMRDMGSMLEGKSGDELDKAFLEGMIPHHQGAVDMAQHLVRAKHPELQALGKAIIEAQNKEIAQMKQWQKDWGYSQKGNNALEEHCKMMPEMSGCEAFR